MDTTQLDRMASFGSDKVDVNTGQVELGLNRNEIQKFITANVQRAKDIPGAVSPTLCKMFAEQEYPVFITSHG